MWVNKRQTDGISDGISLYNEHNRKKPHRNYLDPNFTYVLESKISFVSQLANKVGFDFRCTDWDPVKLELNFDDTENISKLIHLKNLKCQPVRGQKFTAQDEIGSFIQNIRRACNNQCLDWQAILLFLFPFPNCKKS